MKVAYLWCLLLLVQNLNAQRLGTNKEYLGPSRCWGLSLTPAIVTRATVTGDKDIYHVKTASQFGGEILINYNYRFEGNYALIVGGGLNFLGFNFDYNIPKDMFNPPTEANISTNGAASREMNIINFRVPVELERVFNDRKDNEWLIRAGGSLLFSVQQPEQTSYEIYYPNGGPKPFLDRYQSNNNHGKIWFGFQLLAGHRWLLKKNAFQAGLKVNYCPTKFVDGEYHFNVGSQPEHQGRYGVTGSYIGLSIEYILKKSPSQF
ncbi:MAG: hypothetical protein ABIQ31_05515 [Ferruginibacter sp.]